MATFTAMYRLKFAGNLNTVKVIGGNFSWTIVVWKQRASALGIKDESNWDR